MKKKRRIIIAIIILIILVIPVKLQYKDGGTIEYKALTYKIIKWHSIDNFYDNGYKTGTEIHFFPNNFKSLDYYREVKPERFGLIYNDKTYLSEVLSYCWSNDYNSVCADTLGPLDINYREVIKVEKNGIMHYSTYIPITSIKIYNEKENINYNVEFNNKEEVIRVPNLEGTYIMEVYYKCSEGNVNYSFKLDIN